jgi:hypothetical protein
MTGLQGKSSSTENYPAQPMGADPSTYRSRGGTGASRAPLTCGRHPFQNIFWVRPQNVAELTASYKTMRWKHAKPVIAALTFFRNL